MIIPLIIFISENIVWLSGKFPRISFYSKNILWISFYSKNIMWLSGKYRSNIVNSVIIELSGDLEHARKLKSKLLMWISYLFDWIYWTSIVHFRWRVSNNKDRRKVCDREIYSAVVSDLRLVKRANELMYKIIPRARQLLRGVFVFGILMQLSIDVGDELDRPNK